MRILTSALMAMEPLRMSSFVDSSCIEDYEECRLVYNKISKKFGKHRLVKPKEAVQSLATSLWMYDRMDDGELVNKNVEL